MRYAVQVTPMPTTVHVILAIATTDDFLSSTFAQAERALGGIDVLAHSLTTFGVVSEFFGVTRAPQLGQ